MEFACSEERLDHPPCDYQENGNSMKALALWSSVSLANVEKTRHYIAFNLVDLLIEEYVDPPEWEQLDPTF
jgi:hypothetical protein